MGIYLFSIDAADWFDDDEGGWAATATALNAELARQGSPPYQPAASSPSFEEKLAPPMDSFTSLCRQHVSEQEFLTLCDWTVLVPPALDEEIRLPIESRYTESTVIAGAPQVVAIAESLAAAIALPAEVPVTPSNLQLTTWFLDGPAKDLAASRPGRWSDDLDATFYVAVYLRAAQHSLRHNTPIAYS